MLQCIGVNLVADIAFKVYFSYMILDLFYREYGAMTLAWEICPWRLLKNYSTLAPIMTALPAASRRRAVLATSAEPPQFFDVLLLC